MYSIHARNNIGIHDRSPFSAILYTIIHDKAYDFDNLNSVFAQIAELDLIKPHEKFLVVLPNPENFTLVLDLMIKRANNIDELTEDYIYRQYKVFFEFAKYFHLPTFEVSHKAGEILPSIELLYNNVVYLFNSSIFMSTPISKTYVSDASYDLTLQHDYLIRPFEKVKLMFNETIVIPLNYAGFLCARSSINLHGCLRIGLIDASFNGQLSAVFVADSEKVSFNKGERVGQVVIFPIANQLPVIVSPKSLLPSVFRGQNCFGSTGKF